MRIFFGEVCIMVFVSFLIWLFVFLLLNSKNSLFLDVSFADIFPSLSLIALLLTFSFTEQKFLVLMNCSLSVTSFLNHASGVLSKKSFLHSMLSRCSCMLPPRSFIVLYFTFRSVIHFELIFVKGVRSRFSFWFFFCRRCQIVLTPFVEKLFFLNAILCSLVKDQLTIFMGVYF